jgi:hypothetical protein
MVTKRELLAAAECAERYPPRNGFCWAWGSGTSKFPAVLDNEFIRRG